MLYRYNVVTQKKYIRGANKMEYPNHRKCCGTCANWKEPKRVISPDRTKVSTEGQIAVCQVINSAGQEMGGGCSACAKYRKLPMLR